MAYSSVPKIKQNIINQRSYVKLSIYFIKLSPTLKYLVIALAFQI